MRRKAFLIGCIFQLWMVLVLYGCVQNAQIKDESTVRVPTVRFERWQGLVTKTNTDTKHLFLHLADGSERKVLITDSIWYFDGKAWPNKESFDVLKMGKGNMLSIAGLRYSDRDELVANQEVRIFSYEPGQYIFEGSDWWSSQALKLAEFWIKAQFEAESVDNEYRPIDAKGDLIEPEGRSYRTRITKEGHKRSDTIQETATLSRLIYGLSTAYLMNGTPGILEAAKSLVNYQRKYMYKQIDENHIYWIHARKKENGAWVDKIESLYNYDNDTIPIYEQIYDLAGLTQYYRITGDPEVLEDIEKTVAFMNDYYWDRRPENDGRPKGLLRQGYFSHIRDNLKDVDDDSLIKNDKVNNKLKKNWNSIGDHIPAYLENLYFATHNKDYLDRMTELGLIIANHFPSEDSPFVYERFNEFWEPDLTYDWQQNRGVVGHNLKIGWCLTRLYHLTGNNLFLETAQKVTDAMNIYGQDKERGGWYDVIERKIDKNNPFNLTFHNRKAWWQQEQGILANYVLYTTTSNKKYVDSARYGAAFYNLAFLDRRDNGTFFDVQSDGTPFLGDDERADKGSHSKSGYHDFELAYFAHLYTNLLVNKRSVVLYFKPIPAVSGKVFYIQPTSFPKETVKIEKVEIDGVRYYQFSEKDMSIQLPEFKLPITVAVTLSPT